MTNIHLNKNKIIIFVVLIIGVICGSLTGAFFALTHDLPQIRSLEIYIDEKREMANAKPPVADSSGTFGIFT